MRHARDEPPTRMREPHNTFEIRCEESERVESMRHSMVILAGILSLALRHAAFHHTEQHVGAGPPQAFADDGQPESSQRRIIFVSEWEGKEEIYVMNPDGSNVQRLTTTKTGTGS